MKMDHTIVKSVASVVWSIRKLHALMTYLWDYRTVSLRHTVVVSASSRLRSHQTSKEGVLIN